MRVFALSTWCPHPTVNGSTLRAYHLLRAIASTREVDLATFTPFGTPPEASLRHLRSFCRSVTVIEHSPFAADATTRASPLSLVPRSLIESDRPAVHDLARRASERADVSIGLQLAAARYLDAVTGATIFEEAEPTMIEHLWRAESSPRRRLARRLTWWKHAAYLRRLIGRMERTTVASDVERETLARIGCDRGRIRVIPNGVEEDDLSRPRAAPAARIVYAGSVTYRPNLDAVTWFLANVMPHVKARRPDVDLWVTGATGDVPIADLPNRASAQFTGELPDVKAAVGDSAVAIAPIRIGGGTRLKVLEALALGTPVVSTHKGAEGLDLVDREHVLLADTPEGFASAVLDVLNDEALARRLSDRGRARVAEKYTWRTIGDELTTLVTEAVHTWRRRSRQTVS